MFIKMPACFVDLRTYDGWILMSNEELFMSDRVRGGVQTACYNRRQQFIPVAAIDLIVLAQRTKIAISKRKE